MASIDRKFFIPYLLMALVPHRSEFRAVLPGGTFPGPVITGQKGDRFQINVHDQLTDATMLRSTSIVRRSAHRASPFDLRLS